jgi:hypothetical protein
MTSSLPLSGPGPGASSRSRFPSAGATPAADGAHPGGQRRCEERAGPLPAFVKGELEGFAGCGDFELGFVRTCCRSCGDELRVPFSCKSRGCCPSCMGRRMAEGAALLVDHVLPAVGYRQWVLSFPGPMAVRL